MPLRIPHSTRAQSAASARLAPGDCEAAAQQRAPVAPAPRPRGACAGRGRRGGVGGPSREGSCYPAGLLPRAVGCQIGEGWGSALRQAARASYSISAASSLSLSPFGPARGLGGRLPRERGAPHEDFGRAPRTDKGVGDGDTSMTTASGRGRRGRIAAGTPARAQRQLCGSSGAGWEASITPVLLASLKPPTQRLSEHPVPAVIHLRLTEDHFLACSPLGPSMLPRSASHAAQVCHRAGAEAASAPTPEITW